MRQRAVLSQTRISLDNLRSKPRSTDLHCPTILIGRRTRMAKIVCFVCLAVPMAYLAFSYDCAGAKTRSYVEDFSSLEHSDTVNTTALWDTTADEIKLHPFEPTAVGSLPLYPYATGEGIAVGWYHAYLTTDTDLFVLDVRDPESPRIVAFYSTIGGAVDVVLSGDYAFLAEHTSGLEVVDISDPEGPSYAGLYDSPGAALAVAINGDYAYVADYTSGLRVVDISDPTTPVLAGSYATPSEAWGVAVSGNYAYVADGASGLQVVDISDPTNPSGAGSYSTPDHAYQVAIQGDYAYVADGASGLQVLDISDPTNPGGAGSCDTPGQAVKIVLSGDHAYVADGDSGLQVVDISDPTNPTLETDYETLGAANGLALSGNHAYLTDSGAGLVVLAVSDPVGPLYAGSYESSGGGYSVTIRGDYAYTSGGSFGIHVLDISDPTNPTYAGSYDTPDFAYDIAVEGDYAFVADSDSGLRVLDVSDPANPSYAGSYDALGSARCIALSGDYAFVGDFDAGLRVLDISDPQNPSPAGSDLGFAGASCIAISGNYAYLTIGSDGLRLIDISDPTNPSLASIYDTPGDANSVVVSGDYAYVADGSAGGLQIVDISDPLLPGYAGDYDTPGIALDVAINGHYAYITDGDSGLWVVDVSDSANPILASGYATENMVWGMALSGDYAYIGSYGTGFSAIEISQRQYDLERNTARSLPVDQADDIILAARLTTTQTDSVKWELSADSGSTWNPVLPGADYETLVSPGKDLLWRSTHLYAGDGMNPLCTSLSIEWLHRFPVISSVTDIPNDQGKQVSLSWVRSGHDAPGAGISIIEYAIFRRIDYAPALLGQTESEEPRAYEHRTLEGPKSTCFYPPGEWHFLMTVPADTEDDYAIVAPTLEDSTIADGMVYTVFFVRARTSTPGVYFDSYPDSGYSVDNLAPAPPRNLRMVSSVELAWDESEAEDFDYFSVYGSAEPVLDETATLVGYTIATIVDISGDAYDYYHVTATDFSGNEGGASSVENAYSGLRGDGAHPESYALRQNRPNPFGRETLVEFDLPEPGALRLEILDIQGRVVRTLIDQVWPGGRHSVTWDGMDDAGRNAAPGVYFVKINAGDFTKTRKVLLMK
jgi:hypothetical protein